MFVAFVYFLLILFIIQKTRLLGVLACTRLSAGQLSLVFFLKALAVPAMYLVYSKFYGGIESFDSGVFYHDAVELNHLSLNHPAEFFKAMLGLQDDSSGSFFHENYIKKTFNWDNGRIRLLFYNDNRVVIRLHAVLHFIAFDSYFVHALFSCLLSFVGVYWIYNSLKSCFHGREFYLLLCLALFPSLWIHTGALLKEGPALFVMGGFMHSTAIFVNRPTSLFHLVSGLFLLFISLLLKPYLLLYALICFTGLTILQKLPVRRKALVFLALLGGSVLALDFGVRLKQKHSLYEIAEMRQVVFSDAAKGGIFLIDSVKLIRLQYDTSLVMELKEKKGLYKIKLNSPYMYWEHMHQQDTFVCSKNTDTSSVYQLAYTMPESSSNLDYPTRKNSLPAYILNGFYYTLAYPLFFNAKSTQHLLASCENSLLLISLLISFFGLLFSKQARLPAIVFLCFALGECLLIAWTSPNTGAIVRYRSPAVVFIVVCALYYFPVLKNWLNFNSRDK